MKARKRDIEDEEEFIPVKIVTAAIKAMPPVTLADELAKADQEHPKYEDAVDSSEMRTFVLGYSKERGLRAYENWLRFNSKIKETSF